MHRWNTCPLTPSALRFSLEACCDQAETLMSRPAGDPEGADPAAPPLLVVDQPPMLLADQSPNDAIVSAAAWSSGV